MQVRALKSFAGRYGHIRVGQIFSSAPNYAQELVRNGLVAIIDKPPGPDNNRAIPTAPQKSETPPPKEPTGKDGATGNTERAPAGGKVRTSSSLRADLASRRKMRKPSDAGETPTETPAAP